MIHLQGKNLNNLFLSNLFRQVHQTKSEVIAQENSLIRLKLQALKKNKGYLKSIENQFSNLLQNQRYVPFIEIAIFKQAFM